MEGLRTKPQRLPVTTKNSPQPETIAYGVRAIGKVINEPNDRRVNYLLERGYIAGAWKAGRRLIHEKPRPNG